MSTKNKLSGFNQQQGHSRKNPFRAIGIASSTGGPQALMKIFESLKGRMPNLPVFISQHMQPEFTPVLAGSITEKSGLICKEALDGEVIEKAHVYIAPGDFHLLVEAKEGKACIKLSKTPPVNSCRPSADPMLTSLSDYYGSSLLSIVLTGMGCDGTDGANYVYKNKGTVIAQSERSSVVPSMPRSVIKLGICSAIIDLENIADFLVQECNKYGH